MRTRCKSKLTLKERLESYIYYSIDGCWYWLAYLDKEGYGWIWFDGRLHRAHRASYVVFKGDTNGLCVCHHCDNRNCINPNHLFLGTHQDNTNDKIRKGRARYGAGGGRPSGPYKLSNEQVIEIKKLITTESGSAVARMFNVSNMTISKIKNGHLHKKIN